MIAVADDFGNADNLDTVGRRGVTRENWRGHLSVHGRVKSPLAREFRLLIFTET